MGAANLFNRRATRPGQASERPERGTPQAPIKCNIISTAPRPNRKVAARNPISCLELATEERVAPTAELPKT
tara:strand:- start:166 stop:381 length:216 start_codon:yes stop_codon:yes gene_type:complete